MARVHAFGDDPLQDLDAVGLVEAYRDGLVGGRRGRGGDRPRRRRRRPARGAGPRGLRRGAGRGPRAASRLLLGGADLPQGQRRRRRHAHPERHRRLRRPAGRRGRRLRPDVPRHRAAAARQDEAQRVRLQRRGRPPAPRPGAHAVEPRALRRGLVGGVGGVRRHRGGPDRPRQRRRRLDPDPGLGQRAGRPQAHARPAGPGPVDAPDAGADRLRRRADPLGARHRGVLPRGREGLPRPAAGPGRATSPGRAAAGSGWRS